MARGDFRGSIGTLIQSPSVRVYDTSGAHVDFTNGYDGKADEYQAIVDTMRNITQTASDVYRISEAKKERDLREAEIEAERQAREIQKQTESRDRWQGDIRYRRYVRDYQSFMQNLPYEDLGLSQAELQEKYGDQIPTLDLTGISTTEIRDRLTAEAQLTVETFNMSRLLAYQKGQTLSAFTEFSDELVASGDYSVDELVKEGRSASLSDTEIWTALTSTARSQLAMGNPEAVSTLYHYAAENVSDPALREDVMRTLEPLYARANQTQRTRKTMQELIAIDRAQTFSELDAIFSASDYDYSDSEKLAAYRRVEQDNIKEHLKEAAIGGFEGSGDLTQMRYFLSETHSIEGKYGNYEIRFSESEIDSLIDGQFREALLTDPEQAGKMIANSTRAPRLARRIVNDLFIQGFSEGDLDVESEYFAAFATMDTSTELDRASFINKFGLEGIPKEIYTLYHFEKEKGMRSLEDNLRYAIQTVKRAKDSGTFSDPREVEEALDLLFETEIDSLMSPRQRHRAREAARVYALTMNADTAAEAALEDGKSLGVTIGDIMVDNGFELQPMLQTMIRDYYGVTPQAALESVIESVTKVKYSYSYFDDATQTLQVFDVENGIPYTFTRMDMQEIISEKFKGKRLDDVLRRRDLERELIPEQLKHMPLYYGY